MSINYEEYLESIGFQHLLQDIHCIIVEKFYLDNVPIDSWWSNNPQAVKNIVEIGRRFIAQISTDKSLMWKKDGELWEKILEKYNLPGFTYPNSPDGLLAGLAILLAGWVANHYSAKTLYDKNNPALNIFQNTIRPLICAAMDVGLVNETF